VFSKKKSWSLIVQPDKSKEDRMGKLYTLLTAISIYGVELFLLCEGSVDSPTWCYFISEL